MKKYAALAAILAACIGMAGEASAVLINRGNGMIYDSDLNITWLQDANYAKTSGYTAGGVATDGRMNWGAATTWAANLVYGGYDDWRLPTVAPINGSSFRFGFSNNGSTDVGYGITSTQSELAHMFYVSLGNLGICAPDNSNPTSCVRPSGWGLANSAPFTNLNSYRYWFGNSFVPDPGLAWCFYTETGYQVNGLKSDLYFAWAVRSGDVAAAVPEPASLALLGAGLVGWLGFHLS